MTTRTLHTAALGPAAVLAAFVLLCTPALAAETVSPLPPSAYTVHAACPSPSPGHAACLALALVPQTAQARSHTHPLGVANAPAQRSGSPAAGDFGLTPEDLHAAYQLPLSTETSSSQTIALVDAYNDLTAESDLETYDEEFGLPKCTAANKCFEKVNQNGEATSPPFPQSQSSLMKEEKLCEEGHGEACFLVEEAEGWSVEMSLDIETAHAICQNCHIALVEANSPSYVNLEAAEDAAVQLGASEISNSWAGPECVEGTCVEDSSAFKHPGIVITAAAGDDGYLNWLEEPRRRSANFPASSPRVIAVGGTRLNLTAGHKWVSETVWNDGGESGGIKDGHGASGGGCSTEFTAQPWQQNVADWSSVGCGNKRAIADVSADADPYTGVAVYDSQGIEEGEEWGAIGGTSLASPLIAATFALAGGANGVEYPARTLYENAVKSPESLHDVTVGSTGECLSPFDEQTRAPACTTAAEAKASCSSHLICQAGAGYDGPTGVGTPDGITAFQPPVGSGSGEPTGPGEEPTGPEEGGKQGESPAPKSSSGSGAPASGGGSSGSALLAITATPMGTPSIQLSGLALTLKALIALNTSRPQVAKIGFTFMITAATHVRVSLERRVAKRGHAHWQALTHPLMIAAVSGRNNRRLGGHGVLSDGTYRLTLAPVHGTARSIVFEIS